MTFSPMPQHRPPHPRNGRPAASPTSIPCGDCSPNPESRDPHAHGAAGFAVAAKYLRIGSQYLKYQLVLTWSVSVGASPFADALASLRSGKSGTFTCTSRISAPTGVLAKVRTKMQTGERVRGPQASAFQVMTISRPGTSRSKVP